MQGETAGSEEEAVRGALVEAVAQEGPPVMRSAEVDAGEMEERRTWGTWGGGGGGISVGIYRGAGRTPDTSETPLILVREPVALLLTESGLRAMISSEMYWRRNSS